MFYILKVVGIKDIRENFSEMLQEHETKQDEMFRKPKKLVLDLISGHQALLKQRLDQLCDSLISVKTDVEEVKKALVSSKTIRPENFEHK